GSISPVSPSPDSGNAQPPAHRRRAGKKIRNPLGSATAVLALLLSRDCSRLPTRRAAMPLVNVRLIAGVFTPAQKQEMIRRLTEAIVSIEGEGLRAVTWVVVEEVESGDWGMGGLPVTSNDVRALAGRAAT